jgi:hypothetical protein
MKRPPSSAASPRRAAIAAALALAAAALSLPPSTALAQDNVQKVKELHKKGQKAFDAANYPAAYDAYLAAWNLQKSYDIATNLAQSEVETKRFRDAAEHLTYALANLPVAGKADQLRASIQAVLDRAKKEIGVITVRVDVPGATVTLDGRPLGTAPLQEEIFVDPGDHVLGATTPDRVAPEQKVHLDKGGTSLVMLTLEKKTPVAPRPTPSTGPRPLTIAGASAAGAAAVAVVPLAALAKAKGDTASSLRAELGANGCAASASTKCQDLHSALKAHDAFANAALWAGVGAAVLGAGTLVYTLVAPAGAGPQAAPSPGAPSPGAPVKQGVSVVPIFSAGGGGILVHGTF